ncbi:MAG: 6,7-dimethyl-8-ribityllumazine synthase [Phycisphaerae bacterium]|nr:6,7-dimethyl-8-ribityllumazine synthase [Phycisphaerae bacterium]
MSSYHRDVTDSLRAGAHDAFVKAGGSPDNVVAVPAPGAFELPLLASAWLRRADIAAVVAIGCVVRGETRHDRYICDAVTAQLARLAVDVGKPVGYGLLTVENMKQARERAGGKVGNKGAEAMDAVLAALHELEEARAR